MDYELLPPVVAQALEAGLPVAATIAEVFDLNYETARRALSIAQAKGIVPPLRVVVSGHLPVKATIYRGTKRERSWTVCQCCLVTWPCQDAPDRGPSGSEGPA